MTARVYSWDWRQQPDLPAIAASVTELSASGQVFMREIDMGGDNYAWIVSDAELTDEQAWQAYAGDCERG